MSRNCAAENTHLPGSLRLPGEVYVKIPDGSIVELEVAHDISSKNIRTGDAIAFRVACPVIVDGATLITAGRLVTGDITGIEEGGYDQPDKIAWNVEEVIAVDGTSIPLQLSVILSVSEDSRMNKRELAVGALMFPAAPLALLFLSRQKENIAIRAGERFRATVSGDIEVLAQPSKE